MNKVNYFLGVLVLLIISCKENEPFLFEDVATLQFGPPPGAIYQPGSSAVGSVTAYTFFYQGEDVDRDTVYFDIYAIGGLSSKDRPFKLEQQPLENVNNAVAGVHYVSLDDPAVQKEYTIKAGQMHSRVPVVLLRDVSLKTSDIVLNIGIVESADFKNGERDFLWRNLTVTDRINQPAAWSGFYQNNYYGKYSARKHKFMIEVTGELWDQTFMTSVHADLTELAYYMSVIKTALIDYNKLHPADKLKDEFEDFVTFP